MFLTKNLAQRFNLSSLASIRSISITLFLRRFSTTNQSEYLNPIFIADFLIKSLSLSQEKAIRASNQLKKLKSIQKPDSVIRYLRNNGFSDAQIAAAVGRLPSLLCCKLESTIKRNMEALLELGLTQSTVAEIVMIQPIALTIRLAPERVKFWRSFIEDDEKFLRLLRRNNRVLCADIGKRINPLFSRFRDLGFTDNQIRTVVSSSPSIVSRNMDNIEGLVKTCEQLGCERNSGMLLRGLAALDKVSEKAMKEKVEILKGFGWSNEEFAIAFVKCPTICMLSPSYIQKKMEFLVGIVGCTPSYIAHRSVLLNLSLQNRLLPRYKVLEILKAKLLFGSEKAGILKFMIYPEEEFIRKYIIPHVDDVPELLEVYGDGKVLKSTLAS